MRTIEQLVEVFQVTERRDGCVYKTKSLGLKWVPMGAMPEDEDLEYHSPSTSVPWPHIRSRKETK